MSGASAASKPSWPGGFEETLKDFWVSRPRRPRTGRKIAGVAAAIGNRYGIDPVVVRVAFATATLFGGVGPSLYVLAWLFFPGEDDEVSPVEALVGRGRGTMSKHFTIVLVIALFPLSSWAFAGGWFDGGGVIGLALLVTALYLLHRSRGQHNRPVAPVTETPAAFTMTSANTAAPMTSANAAAAGTPATPGVETPAGWDPLGASPRDWDLPDPAPEPVMAPPPAPPPTRRKSKVGVVAFGIALLVGGVGVALGLSGESWFSPPHVIGLALGVLGLGMVVGAFLNGGRGLIGWAIPLSIAGLVTTTVPVGHFTGGFGDINAMPRTAAEVQPVYQHSAGNIELNLTRLTTTTPVTTSISNGAGDTTVLVPPDADVRYSCENHAGNVDCLDHRTDGVGAPVIAGVDLGPDGPGGQQITVAVIQGAGSVEVRRG
ncbi:MAG TPA: PspC domain-containing protein [Amycolatopsis sp.]|nr:PspC domain-containing protein [Amycolatopsis sp.]